MTTELQKILDCPGGWGAAQGTTYACGIQEYQCAMWEGSAPCQCQGRFWRVGDETFTSFEDAAGYLFGEGGES